MKKLHFLNAVVLLGGGLFLVSSGVVWFLYSQIAEKRESIQTLRGTLTEMAVQEQRASSIRSSLRETESMRRELSEYLLHQEGVPAFFAQIEEAGREAGADITLKEAKVLPKDDASASVELLRFTLVAQGSFASLMHTTRLLEALPQDASIDSLTLLKDGTAWEAVMHVSVTKAKEE